MVSSSDLKYKTCDIQSLLFWIAPGLISCIFILNNIYFFSSSSSSPLMSLVTSTSEISHQPVHTYTTYIYDKGVDRTGRQGIEEKYSII